MKLKFSPPKININRIPFFTSVVAFVGSFALGVFFYHEYSIIDRAVRGFNYYDHSADCAVVLTGGPTRVREGFDLLSAGKVKKLIISGVHQDVALRDLLPLWPVYGNLNEDDVFLEKRAETTFGNAQQSLPLVEALRCREILLVTSILHMPRAYATFRSSYPDTIDIVPHPVMGQRRYPGWTEVGIESIKSMFYTMFFY
ncbi:MAG: YdcF family protein [Bdellovibrionota bacterium]